MSKKKRFMKILKKTKTDQLAELNVVNAYGSVDFFQMKKVFPLLVTRILELESRLKTLQRKKGKEATLHTVHKPLTKCKASQAQVIFK